MFSKPNSHFSSGPTKKPYPIDNDLLGRSHRSKVWIARIQALAKQIREKLEIPANYQFAFISGSATGAVETLLWNLVGAKTIDIFSNDPFGEVWRHDVIHELQMKDYQDNHVALGGTLPFSTYNPAHDCVFVYAATPVGTQVPHLDWIPAHRSGLTLCDATSAAFGYKLDWSKLDATGFSFQKALGAEAGMGAIVLSPRAQERIAQFTPQNRAIPRLYNIKNYPKVFEGFVINTPSLMVLEDIGRCLALWSGDAYQRVVDNFDVVRHWVNANDNFAFLAPDLAITSRIAPCITVKSFTSWDDYAQIAQKLEDQGIAYDILGHTLGVPSFRFWCGPFIEKADLSYMMTALEREILQAYLRQRK